MNVPQQKQAMWNDSESKNRLETAQDCNDIYTYAQSNTTCVMFNNLKTNCCGALVKAHDIPPPKRQHHVCNIYWHFMQAE